MNAQTLQTGNPEEYEILNEKIKFLDQQFFQFLQMYVFYCCGKTGQKDFPQKRDSTKIKHYYQSAKFYGILRKEHFAF